MRDTTSIATKLGCVPETLRQWVQQAQRDSGVREGVTTAERERVKELIAFYGMNHLYPGAK